MMIGAPLSRLPGGLYVDLEKGDHRRSVFLAGSGRSGTTWLSEIINHRRGYRYVFEPFNPRVVGPFGHFRTKQYLRPDDQREEFLEPARLALTGRLRHPCAVVASRLALGWRDNLSETMEQRELVEDFLLPMEAEIRAAKDDFERHLFLWCIDNYVPLKQFCPHDVLLTFYENLLARPEAELQR